MYSTQLFELHSAEQGVLAYSGGGKTVSELRCIFFLNVSLSYYISCNHQTEAYLKLIHSRNYVASSKQHSFPFLNQNSGNYWYMWLAIRGCVWAKPNKPFYMMQGSLRDLSSPSRGYLGWLTPVNSSGALGPCGSEGHPQWERTNLLPYMTRPPSCPLYGQFKPCTYLGCVPQYYITYIAR